jgi:hypothetical protein
MAELHAYFTNCPILGEERTKYANGSRLDTIRLDHGGFQFRIVQRRDHLGYQPTYKNANVVTSDVFVRDVTPQNLERVNKLLFELSCLLSFATYSDVAFSGYDFKHGTTLGQRWATVGRLQHFRPPFELADGKAIRLFLQQAWPMFSKLQKSRKLGIAIHYVLLADRDEQPVEAGLLLVFIALELLKSTFARSRGIPFIAGKFRRISSPPKPNPKKEHAYTFQELLKMMLREVKMGRTPVRALVRLRNTIIHDGIANAKFSTLSRMYASCQDTLREYLLRLCEYHGSFLLYSNPRGVPKNVP